MSLGKTIQTLDPNANSKQRPTRACSKLTWPEELEQLVAHQEARNIVRSKKCQPSLFGWHFCCAINLCDALARQLRTLFASAGPCDCVQPTFQLFG